MSRDVIEHVIWEMGHAFDSMFHNLKDLNDDDWGWLPPGGARSISDIVVHLASSKVMNDNHAFGDGTLTWQDPLYDGAKTAEEVDDLPPETLVAWLRDAQLRLLRNVDALADDEELRRPRPVSWGGTRETRWIINRLIHHDGYHAGEINHLRSIHHGDDRWEWVKWDEEHANDEAANASA